MSIQQKVALSKAILQRIYRQRAAPQEVPGVYWTRGEAQCTIRSYVLGALWDAGINPAEFAHVVLPQLKEDGYLVDFSAWDEEDFHEYSLTFNPEVLEAATFPLEVREPEEYEVGFNIDGDGDLVTYGTNQYQLQGGYQKEAFRELWQTKAITTKGFSGSSVKLHTLGSRIRFEDIESAQQIQRKMERDPEFKERLKNVLKTLNRGLQRHGIPATITSADNSYLLTIER